MPQSGLTKPKYVCSGKTKNLFEIIGLGRILLANQLPKIYKQKTINYEKNAKFTV